MKKRLSCVLCALLLLLPMTCGAVNFDYTIPELIQRQLKSNTTLKVKLSAEASGDAPFFMDTENWEKVKTLSQFGSLQATYIQSKSTKTLSDTQVRLLACKGEDIVSTLIFSGRDDTLYISGDAIGNTTFSMPRDMNDLSEVLFSTDEGTWGSLYRAAFAIMTADDEWKTSFESAIASCYDVLSSWIQENTVMTLKKEADGTLLTQSVFTASLQDAAKEAQVVLEKFYQQTDALNLLRQRLSQNEAETLLEGGMLPLFIEALDQIDSEESVTLIRVYNVEGTLVSEQIDLPFDTGSPFMRLTYSMNGNEKSLKAAMASGDTLQISVTSAAQGVYTGSLAFNPDNGGFACKYSLTYEVGAETYDAEDVRRERKQKISGALVLESDEGSAVPSLCLTADIQLVAGASTRNPGRVIADITYTEPGKDTNLLLKYRSFTAEAINQAEVDTETAEAIAEDEKPLDSLLFILLAAAVNGIENVTPTAAPVAGN